jgi:transcriptional regulator with XRE-family HTH domain
VSDHGSPTVRRRRLAAELHRLRERSGLTGDQVAERLGWSPSKISRIENTRSGLKIADARKLLDLYGVDNPKRDELLAMTREADQKAWWEAYSGEWPEGFSEFIGMEAEAEVIMNWEPQVVPGLLQTEGYAREVITSWQLFTRTPPLAIERRVQARLRRQDVLNETSLRLSAIVDESVLLRRFGDNSVMRDQLDRLIEVSTAPNVTLQVLPLAGEHPIATGAFSLLRFAQVHGVAIPEVAYVEQMTDSQLIKEETATYYHQVAFGVLLERSLDPAKSRDVIVKARDNWL